MSQAIKGLPTDEQDAPDHIEECLRTLRRAKAHLWHGSPHRALHTTEELTWDIGTESERAQALQDKLEEFMNYVMANLATIPNYADRHRHGEAIATGFVESAVNQVVSKRFVKQQQMRWTPMEHTGCCRSGPACSISSCARTSSAGTRSYGQTPILFAWRRSTRNGPLSRAYVTKTSIEQ